MTGTTGFLITTEAELDADIAAIDVGGTAAATATDYLFTINTDLSMTNNIPAIDLLAGDTLTIDGYNPDGANFAATIDGGDGVQGLVVNSGTVDLSNLMLTAMSAPGGTGGTPGGGGALYVGAGAVVSASDVIFSGDRASGGTPAGGAVFVAQGGTFSLTGGSLAGAGNAAGNGIFMQGDNSIALSNTTITGSIADQTGSGLGVGAGTLDVQGAVTLAATNHFTGGIEIGTAAGATGTLTLAAPGAAGSGSIAFENPIGDILAIGTGDVPSGHILGFVPNPGAGSASSDTIDLTGIGTPVGHDLSATNTLTVTGTAGAAALHLDPAVNYGGDTFVLSTDTAGTGTDVTVVQSAFQIGSEADLNAALAEIDAGGKFAAPDVAYTFTFTNDITLGTDLDAINLLTGSSITIDGAGFALDGAGAYRGFFDDAGSLTLQNMTIRNAVATGGAGGAGATPGGGGAGLGGGLFVASGAAATLADVTFLDDEAVGGAGGAAGSRAGRRRRSGRRRWCRLQRAGECRRRRRHRHRRDWRCGDRRQWRRGYRARRRLRPSAAPVTIRRAAPAVATAAAAAVPGSSSIPAAAAAAHTTFSAGSSRQRRHWRQLRRRRGRRRRGRLRRRRCRQSPAAGAAAAAMRPAASAAGPAPAAPAAAWAPAAPSSSSKAAR